MRSSLVSNALGARGDILERAEEKQNPRLFLLANFSN